ncbi:hypothetical protein BJ170DRAFT_306491 [Xylariales sp. AK1849]|nr:hypothetical protein BJ170DRAFT_306491 [Xylariales sp. AK1849]
MATEIMQQPRFERLNVEDFETASIRSAAPSYISEAPSYHSTLPMDLPAYTPPASSTSNRATTSTNSPSSMLPSASSFTRGPGLPPIPPVPIRSHIPNLSEFRIGTWSSLNSNPTARHYQAVAHRRVSQQSSTQNQTHLQGALRAALGRLNVVEEERVRPHEDPYLVGEEAAARARRERLAREGAAFGDEVLAKEDRRWDWFLTQMNDWDERSASWREFETRRRRRFGR